jgi:hypothetical protein
MGMRTYSYDAFMQLADGAAAVTADGIAQVASASKILDLGGAKPRTDIGLVGSMARLDAVVVLDVSAITTATDGQVNIWVLGSNNADGSKPVVLGGQQLGLGNLLPNGTAGSEATEAGSTTVAGRREIFFTNEQKDITYRYVYLYVDHLGSTSHSITFTAFVAVLPDMS